MVWVVVLAYMAIITAAGAYYVKYMRTADAYFRGGNMIPWWAAGISMYMANFTAYTFVAIASLVYMRGMPALILETGPALAFGLAAIFLAHRWHRLNLTSPPEYLEYRFNPATRQTFSLMGILSRFLGYGIRLLSMCLFLESVTGMPVWIMILLTGGTIIFYTVMGGLWAVIVTDVLQFIVLLLAVIPLFIISVVAVFFEAGWENFVNMMPAGFASFPNTNPEAAYPGIPLAARAQWQWLLLFYFSYLLDYNGDWGVIQRMCCTPSERDARRAAWLSALLSVPHAFILLGCCFVARVLWSAEIGDPSVVREAEMVYGRVAAKLLPAGLIGVVAAAMFSSTMSTLNVGWAVMSTSFVNDIWQRFLRKDASERELILVGRIAVVVIGTIASLVALTVYLTQTEVFALAQSLIALVVIPVLIPQLLGLLIPKMHRYSALGGFLTAFTFGVLNKLWFGLPFEWEVPISALICIGVMTLSGLIPDRDPAYLRRVADFKRRLRTPLPPREMDGSIPGPIGIVGTFMMLIGALVFLLVFWPQGWLDRSLTLMASLVLLSLGYFLRKMGSRQQVTLLKEAAATGED